MTREQLDRSFEMTWPTMEKVARRKCRLAEDVRDMVHGCYAWVATNDFYASTKPEYAYRSWKLWLLTYMSRTMKAQYKVKVGEQSYVEELGEFSPELLTAIESVEVVEEYWESLTAVQRSRARKRFTEAGQPLLACMKKKKGR